ncbi:MAG: hypothetical protein R6W94_00625 [Spirochaetia bacterium]
MKRLAAIFALIAMALLFTGCEVWLFLADGGGGASGIDVYADISVTSNTVYDDQRLAARLYRFQGSSWSPAEVIEGDLGSDVINETFTDIATGEYILIVWITPDGDKVPEDGDTGWESSSFSYTSGGYRSFVLNDASDWGDENVNVPD